MWDANGDEWKVMMDASKLLDASEASLNSATTGVWACGRMCAGLCERAGVHVHACVQACMVGAMA